MAAFIVLGDPLPTHFSAKVTRQGEARNAVSQPSNITIDELQLVNDGYGQIKAKAIATNQGSEDEELFNAGVVFFNGQGNLIGYGEAYIPIVPANARAPFETGLAVGGNPTEAKVFLFRSER